MENKLDVCEIRETINTFFNELNDRYGVTVSSVSLNWVEHIENGKHVKYCLTGSDVKFQL